MIKISARKSRLLVEHLEWVPVSPAWYSGEHGLKFNPWSPEYQAGETGCSTNNRLKMFRHTDEFYKLSLKIRTMTFQISDTYQ